METKYILITKLNPIQAEFSSVLYKPETDRSIYIIKLISSIRPEHKENSIMLSDDYNFEILDNKLNKSGININNFCVTKITYNSKDSSMTFSIDQGLTVLSQLVTVKRSNFEIRNDVVTALKKIYEIPTSVDIATLRNL